MTNPEVCAADAGASCATPRDPFALSLLSTGLARRDASPRFAASEYGSADRYGSAGDALGRRHPPQPPVGQRSQWSSTDADPVCGNAARRSLALAPLAGCKSTRRIRRQGQARGGEARLRAEGCVRGVARPADRGRHAVRRRAARREPGTSRRRADQYRQALKNNPKHLRRDVPARRGLRGDEEDTRGDRDLEADTSRRPASRRGVQQSRLLLRAGRASPKRRRRRTSRGSAKTHGTSPAASTTA